jgi:hypothetical protein
VGYYVRVFAKSDATVSMTALRQGFDGLGWDAVIECGAGQEDRWTEFRVAHGNGDNICLVQRDDVTPGSLGRREVESFTEALAEYVPRSGAGWVGEVLSRVRVIYAVRVQASDEDGWGAVQLVVDTLASELDGLTHAELEGFYIDDGYYLIAAAPGFERLTSVDEWTVAVRSGGGWTAFVLDPDDETALAAFRRGEVPDGVESWKVTE